MTLLEGIDHIGKLGNCNTRYLSQLLNILGKILLFNVHGLIRTPGRNHHRVVDSLVLGIFNMVMQVINRIISGTNALYMIVSHQTTC